MFTARFHHRRSSTVAANGVVASCSKSGCCSVPSRSPLFLRDWLRFDCLFSVALRRFVIQEWVVWERR
ncbi:hypothetical protein AAHA92_32889 [Salvia divinorum]|uniref:Secreted protein n=1 Tax=Salvia divinorum TaxID=28513 RepID=A0ABD1FMN4_SALDI